jgi:hypothetical protein
LNAIAWRVYHGVVSRGSKVKWLFTYVSGSNESLLRGTPKDWVLALDVLVRMALKN